MYKECDFFLPMHTTSLLVQQNTGSLFEAVNIPMKTLQVYFMHIHKMFSMIKV